jgi:hypothetical protein
VDRKVIACDVVNWIQLVQDRVHWRVVNMEENGRVQ